MAKKPSPRHDRKFRDPLADPPQPHLGYRPTQVAAYTGIPTPTVYRACERGQIQHTRLGGGSTKAGTPSQAGSNSQARPKTSSTARLQP